MFFLFISREKTAPSADTKYEMAKKKSKIGCLFWIALILLVIVIFLFNRERIKQVIESTGFTTFLSNRKEEKEEEKESIEVIREKKEQDEPKIIEVEPDNQQPESVLEEKTAEQETGDPSATEAEKMHRNAKLYFIDVDDEGIISLQAVVRRVSFTDSPLTETVRALLQGMLPSELNMELINLIPENTRLLSIRVSDGTAYINFNEAFRFNSLGKEGYVAQIKQVVYTATEFSTVDSVQILIEGKTYEYLGPEGVFIGQSLTRNSFD
jgi:germination protein M